MLCTLYSKLTILIRMTSRSNVLGFIWVTGLSLIFLLCPWATGSYSLPGKLVPGDMFRGFTYLGSAPSRRGNSFSNNYNESSYFTTAVDHTWREAFELCNDTFGTDGTLVDIESADEANHLLYLVEHNTGDDKFTNFWTNAKFDRGDSFVWSGGEPIGDWIPWEAREPSMLNDRAKVFIQQVENPEPDATNWEMYTYGDTSKRGLICEVRPRNETEPPPPACDRFNELIVVLESSLRVNTVFPTAKNNVIIPTAAVWTQYQYNRIGFIVNYSDGGSTQCETQLVFGLDEELNDFARAKKITDAVYRNITHSRSDCALRAAKTEFDRRTTKGTKRIVFLTTGNFTVDDRAEAVASELRDADIYIFAMGMDSEVNKTDLILLAEKEEFISGVLDFAWLKDKLAPEKEPCNI